MNDDDFFNDADDDLYIKGLEEAEGKIKFEGFIDVDEPSSSADISSDGLSRNLPKNNSKTSSATCAASIEALQCLRRYFGHAEFRHHQWEIISSVLYEKRDQSIIMATGYGKSLCYQFPSLFVGGVTVVISPLISLMEDQVQALNVAGIEACYMGSAQKDRNVRDGVIRGRYKVVYLTPEFIAADADYCLLNQISSTIGLTLIAIDEAHCISQWGHEFRSSYRKLGTLRRKFPRIPFMALTATATPQVQKDIIENLYFSKPLVTCTSFNRPNLYLEVFPKQSGVANDIMQFMKHGDDGFYHFEGSTIIYCPTRKQAEEVCRVLDEIGANVELYHAGMTPKLRSEAHKKFINDECEAIVATVAFGMGIDKPDVRRVIHYGAPKDIESYYQEIGRAGRDGSPSTCSVLYSNKDFVVYSFFANEIKSEVFRKHKQNMQLKMQQYLVTSKCRRSMLLSHFEGVQLTPDEKDTEACCDNCRRQARKNASQRNNSDGDRKIKDLNVVQENDVRDFQEEALNFFKAIQAVKGRFGLIVVVHILRGSHEKRVPSYVYTDPVFGAGSSKSEKWWKAFATILKIEDYLVEKPVQQGYGCTLALSDKARFWMLCKDKNQNKSFLLVPTAELLAVETEESSKKLIQRDHDDSVVAVLSSDKKILPTIKLRDYEPWQNADGKDNVSSQPNANILELEGLLMNKLTNVRTGLARDAEIAPYMVATNRALFEMARIRPTSLELLAKVEDFPEARVKKFGPAFVEFIKKYSDENKIPANSFTAPKSASSSTSLPTNLFGKFSTLTPTVQETYRLLVLEKKSLSDVARIRHFTESTIASHVADAIRANLPFDLISLGVSADVIRTILKAIRSTDIKSDITRLNPIKEKLDDSITWPVLKIAVAVLEYEFGMTKEAKIETPAAVDDYKNHTETFSTTSQSRTSQSEANPPPKRKIPYWMGDSANVGVKKQKSSVFK